MDNKNNILSDRLLCNKPKDMNHNLCNKIKEMFALDKSYNNSMYFIYDLDNKKK